MPKWAAYAIAWVVAAAGALALAFWGVGVVGDQVTGDRPSPLSAAEVSLRATSTTTAPSSTSTSVGETPPTTGATPTVPATTAPARPAATPTTTTTAAPPPPEPAGETRTYNLTGGSASLRFTPSGVTVLWANPNAGFDVEVEPEGAGVKVEFESESHTSRVDGWWDGGPQDRVREDPS